MKEKIYTIPINDAMDTECDCPFCYLYKRLEEDSIDYTLGPAMMEPDFRMITNEKGFCKIHIKKLIEKRNALSLALIMDTHLGTVTSIFENKAAAKSIFKKKRKKEAFALALDGVGTECAVCSRIEHTLSRYLYTFVFMLKKENGFLEKVLSKDGFCIEHFSMLLKVAVAELSDKDFERLFVPVIEIQKRKIEKYREYIKMFSDSFDYRNAGKPLEVPKDILTRTAKLLNGDL